MMYFVRLELEWLYIRKQDIGQERIIWENLFVVSVLDEVLFACSTRG